MKSTTYVQEVSNLRNKAVSVFKLLENSNHTIIAFGNDLNDQELIGYADRSVLVGDRLPGIESAHHVRRIMASDFEVAKALLEEVDFVMGADEC
jgi:hydroxymethylpyrimidine pyrophosphatase-like HAD family hydrolase